MVYQMVINFNKKLQKTKQYQNQPSKTAPNHRSGFFLSINFVSESRNLNNERCKRIVTQKYFTR